MNGSCVVELQRGEQPECPELLGGLRTLRWEASPYHWATRRTEIKVTISWSSQHFSPTQNTENKLNRIFSVSDLKIINT